MVVRMPVLCLRWQSRFRILARAYPLEGGLFSRPAQHLKRQLKMHKADLKAWKHVKRAHEVQAASDCKALSPLTSLEQHGSLTRFGPALPSVLPVLGNHLDQTVYRCRTSGHARIQCPQRVSRSSLGRAGNPTELMTHATSNQPLIQTLRSHSSDS